MVKPLETPTRPSPITDAIADFRRHLTIERGLARATLDAYARDLNGLSQSLAEAGVREPAEIAERHLVEHFQGLSAKHGLAGSSVTRHLATTLSLIHI